MRHLAGGFLRVGLFICCTTMGFGQPKLQDAAIPQITPVKNTDVKPFVGPAQEDPEKLRWEIEKLKAETASLKKSQVPDFWKFLLGVLATVTAPLLLASWQIFAQRRAQQARAEVDARLKAAEIAMNSPSTGQVRAKAAVLTALLADLIPNFASPLRDLDYKKVGFASYRERFLKLLEAISANPDKAHIIVQCYNELFPADDKNSNGKISTLLDSLGHPKEAKPTS